MNTIIQPTPIRHRARRTSATVGIAGIVALSVLATACGDDASGAEPPDPTAATTPNTVAPHDHETPTVVVGGVDYAFSDVPSSTPVGTKLSIANASSAEVHEMVVFRLPDDEIASLAELVAGPPEELETALGAPVTVLLQPPGAPKPIVAVGDGILGEPGRYALMCFIPIGADPDEFMAAVAAADGQPPAPVAGGPPHFTAGMYAEITVE